MNHFKQTENRNMTLITTLVAILTITLLTVFLIYYGPPGKYKEINNYTYENNTLTYTIDGEYQDSTYKLELPAPANFKKEDNLKFAVVQPIFSDRTVIELWVNGTQMYGKGDNLALDLTINNKEGYAPAEYHYKSQW